LSLFCPGLFCFLCCERPLWSAQIGFFFFAHFWHAVRSFLSSLPAPWRPFSSMQADPSDIGLHDFFSSLRVPLEQSRSIYNGTQSSHVALSFRPRTLFSFHLLVFCLYAFPKGRDVFSNLERLPARNNYTLVFSLSCRFFASWGDSGLPPSPPFPRRIRPCEDVRPFHVQPQGRLFCVGISPFK